VNLEADEYVMQVKPASILGDTPSGEIDQGERMIKSGLVSNPTDVLSFMQHPDVQAYVRRKTASRRLCERMLGSMMNGGPQQSPEPEMNLMEAMQLSQETYLQGKLAGTPTENLGKVMEFMKTCKRMIVSAQAPTLPQLPPGAAPPASATGGAPPVAA
jgi:hypothetical protein